MQACKQDILLGSKLTESIAHLLNTLCATGACVDHPRDLDNARYTSSDRIKTAVSTSLQLLSAISMSDAHKWENK